MNSEKYVKDQCNIGRTRVKNMRDKKQLNERIAGKLSLHHLTEASQSCGSTESKHKPLNQVRAISEFCRKQYQVKGNVAIKRRAQIRTTIFRICAISLRICSSSSRSLPSSTCFMLVMLSWTTVKPSRTSRRTLLMFSFCQARISSIFRNNFNSVACSTRLQRE